MSNFSLANFTLGRLLGASRLSEVFQAHREGRNFALKRSLHREHRDLLKREFDCLKTLHHPNIVKVHDWIEPSADTPCAAFTMTQLHGVNGKVLADRLQRLPPSERHERIVKIGLQICSALAHTHHKGWIHRDIKPSNLMFENEHTLLLIDFGTVTKYPMTSDTHGVIGTPRYASPEQLDGKRLTPATDQFSMGATLYFLLVNKRPFESRERTEPMKPSMIDPSIPVHLERIILRCLELDPQHRFETIEDIMSELNHVNPIDQPLAGRESVIHQIAQCLQRVHQGEQLHVHFVGTRGSGKTWAKDTLCAAASQQGIRSYVLNHSDGHKEPILDRIGERYPLIICTSSPHLPKLGLPIVYINIEWLSLSQLRRSVFSHAPKTPQLTKRSQWLYEQTQGIPALLLPMLMEYTIRDAFHIPQDPEELLPEYWIQDMSPLHWSILQAITHMNRSLSLQELQAVFSECTEATIVDLEQRSLIKSQADSWGISCSLVASYVKRHYAIASDLLKKWGANLNSVQSSISIFQDVAYMSAKGELAAAKSSGEQLVSNLSGCQRSEGLVDLGQVYLDIGDHLRAATLLADATTMTSLQTHPKTYLRSQALRGRASLEQYQSSPIGAMHALDRLSKLLSVHDPWVQTVWQWALGALGDQRQWTAHLPKSLAMLEQLEGHHKIRCAFNIIRGGCCIGDMDCVTTLIQSLKDMVQEFPLLQWELERVQSIVSNTVPPVVGSLAYGLSAQEILRFKKRWVRVKGKHPDPTWYQ